LLYHEENWVLIAGGPGASVALMLIEAFNNTLKNSPGLKIRWEQWVQPTVTFAPVSLITAENLDTIDRSGLIMPAK
jgi:hypothetical protein